MTNASEEPDEGITDDQLPDDLVAGEDNPLAEPLPDGESADLGIPEPGEEPEGGDEQDEDAEGDRD